MAIFKRRRFWLVLLLSGLMLGGMVYLLRPKPLTYQTAKAELSNIEQSVLATGQLDAIRKVDVGAQVSGQLQQLYVKIGQQVTAGQILVLVDPQQAQNKVLEVEATLEELEAQCQQAQAELKLVEVTLTRQRVLAKAKAISQQELDKTTTEMAVKRAHIKTILAQIKKNQAALASAKIELAYTRIVAPMAGEVVQITTLQGQTVIAAQQAPNILTLADMHTMLVKAQIPEADVIRLHPGQKVWFTILGDTHTRFYSVLKDIQPTPEKINNAVFYHARFEVPNDNRILRLNMTAQVHILLEEKKQVLTIPLAALGNQQEEGRYQVAVLSKGKEEQREVTIGVRNNTHVQILSGLIAGDEVIISRSNVGVP